MVTKIEVYMLSKNIAKHDIVSNNIVPTICTHEIATLYEFGVVHILNTSKRGEKLWVGGTTHVKKVQYCS